MDYFKLFLEIIQSTTAVGVFALAYASYRKNKIDDPKMFK